MSDHLTVFERGWLSSNCILLQGVHGTALIDSGYTTHSAQTVALVEQALVGAPLQWLINTHLHSDHCGGNAALQQRWPSMRTAIPEGGARMVRDWDETLLSFNATGQHCPRFGFQHTLAAGDVLPLGNAHWQVHAAAGHDPDMVVLFDPQSGTLLSADALWENGFGVIFPEIEGEHAFDVMAQTLDIIEQLQPRYVVPGHGKPFHDATAALHAARSRLEQFATQPRKHAHYAAKVLIKFKLLEWQSVSQETLHQWGLATPYLQRLRDLMGQNEMPMPQWLDLIASDLARSGAAALDANGHLTNL